MLIGTHTEYCDFLSENHQLSIKNEVLQLALDEAIGLYTLATRYDTKLNANFSYDEQACQVVNVNWKQPEPIKDARKKAELILNALDTVLGNNNELDNKYIKLQQYLSDPKLLLTQQVKDKGTQYIGNKNKPIHSNQDYFALCKELDHFTQKVELDILWMHKLNEKYAELEKYLTRVEEPFIESANEVANEDILIRNTPFSAEESKDKCDTIDKFINILNNDIEWHKKLRTSLANLRVVTQKKSIFHASLSNGDQEKVNKLLSLENKASDAANYERAIIDIDALAKSIKQNLSERTNNNIKTIVIVVVCLIILTVVVINIEVILYAIGQLLMGVAIIVGVLLFFWGLLTKRN